jgi:ATP-dependent Lhr-like helicase
LAEQLLRRYGIVTRSTLAREALVGGFGGLYPVLRAMEEAGKARRGYFVEGMGGAQFALPGADDQLRRCPALPDDAGIEQRVRMLSAADPANAYGAVVKWPEPRDGASPMQRTSGASVAIDALTGRLLAYLAKSTRRLVTFAAETAEDEPQQRELIAERLAKLAEADGPVLLDRIDGAPVGESPLCEALRRFAFVSTSRGYLHRGVGRATRLDALAARRDPAEWEQSESFVDDGDKTD